LSITTQNAFTNIKKITKSKYLQNVQYKILHNIYPTMKHLFKWKIKNTSLCGHCSEVETLSHALWECQIAKDTLQCFEHLIKEYSGRNITLTYSDLLVGISSNNLYNNFNIYEKFLIDELLVIIKKTLILQREVKRSLSVTTLNKIIREHLKMYRTNKWKIQPWLTLFGPSFLNSP